MGQTGNLPKELRISRKEPKLGWQSKAAGVQALPLDEMRALVS